MNAGIIRGLGILVPYPTARECDAFHSVVTLLEMRDANGRSAKPALRKLNGFKRTLVGSLSANRQRFGMERMPKVESLEEIIDEMATPHDGTGT